MKSLKTDQFKEALVAIYISRSTDLINQSEYIDQILNLVSSFIPEKKVDNKRWEAHDRSYTKNQVYSSLDLDLTHDEAVDKFKENMGLKDE